MSFCPDCVKRNHDEDLENIKQQAKNHAVTTSEAQAIYKEGGEYKFISAIYAYQNSFNVLHVVSAYQ
jgi:hypothetical protein